MRSRRRGCNEELNHESPKERKHETTSGRHFVFSFFRTFVMEFRQRLLFLAAAADFVAESFEFADEPIEAGFDAGAGSAAAGSAFTAALALGLGSGGGFLFL